MTQIEICRTISEMRDKGVKIAMIVPEEMQLPSARKVYKAVEISPRELLITEVDGCYITAISKITGGEEIKGAVKKIFEKANITSAWNIFFY